MKYPTQIREYKIEELGNISQFGSWKLKSGEKAQCMIEGCHNDATWQSNLKDDDRSVLVCWDHHEQASSLHHKERHKGE